MNRVDPDQHAIDRGELGADGVDNIIFIDHRFSIDAMRGKRGEDGGEPAGLGCDAAARRLIASPKDGHTASTNGLSHGILPCRRRVRMIWR
jgi:hypothetical protein